jgi:hypothetical protein
MMGRACRFLVAGGLLVAMLPPMTARAADVTTIDGVFMGSMSVGTFPCSPPNAADFNCTTGSFSGTAYGGFAISAPDGKATGIFNGAALTANDFLVHGTCTSGGAGGGAHLYAAYPAVIGKAADGSNVTSITLDVSFGWGYTGNVGILTFGPYASLIVDTDSGGPSIVQLYPRTVGIGGGLTLPWLVVPSGCIPGGSPGPITNALVAGSASVNIEHL